jgi:chemotaxis protein MotA
MTTDTAQAQAAGPDPVVKIRPPQVKADFITIVGLVTAMGLIIWAISLGSGNANFINGPSVLMVILGTIAATTTSFSADELTKAGSVFAKAFVRRVRKPSVMARQLMDIAMLARKKGMLALSSLEPELRRDPIVARAAVLVTDGYSGDDVERVLTQELDSLVERHRRSASILRRAAEIAPAMGLIGTLVGLVQMLAELDNPANIGPAMAVALLTTFYGAIMANVILMPLAAKLERNSNDEALIKTLVMLAMGSIARQENPRRLEMLLNSELPPDEQIKYFD